MNSSLNQNIKLIVVHKNGHSTPNNLLRFATCSEPFAGTTFICLNGNSHPRSNNDIIAIPQDWAVKTTKPKSGITYYKENLSIPSATTSRLKANSWFIISNARFVTQINDQWLYKILTSLQADVIAVNVVPQLQAANEKVLTTSQGKLVGFRRLYNDLAQPTQTPEDWPHYILIKTDILSKLLVDNTLPLAFSNFVNRCSLNSLALRSINIGGAVLDLETEAGLLGLLAAKFNSSAQDHRHGIKIPDGTRLFGKVWFGQNVSIAKNVIIAGPTVIGDNAKIGTGTVINSSIVGTGVSIPQNQLIGNRVLVNGQCGKKQTRQNKIKSSIINHQLPITSFRTWSRFSYARCLKRIADIVAATTVLILSAPVLPIIALVIKLTSRGPVFFRHNRQGLHGKAFNCLKFRTMLVGADKMQDKLRVVNQADGPQFKMANDPRLSVVGGFLRDTYIDEIPQFFNVLLGQMSVVGPRPSPESENTLCPSWRDARLSVRPGITGLWQVCRTRQPMKDFQEWIHYDIKYVKYLSLKTDFWICWQTAKKMTENFVRQF